MYLKKLEISGFKSFADSTLMLFDRGVTGIVGPNGCGKSNVSDAIRWCLGEQSARSMRSHQMMDVIFNGSQSRAATGMAEVSLTFDNSQNVLAIDYSEITITRRLFRSGESEYLINKSQCRLKDVRDLFLDTGVGPDGYSIIEQGKVEFLLTARPEERRELFEEAAGVSKYKVRREESLRKLERVEVDMNRINDMIGMLKEQISALDIASKKARQYQKYRTELTRCEIAGLVKNIEHARVDAQRITGELDPRQREFETFNTRMDQLDAELSTARLALIEHDNAYVKRQEEFAQIKSDLALADEKVRQAERRSKELAERASQIDAETVRDSAAIETRRAEAVVLDSSIAGLESETAALAARVSEYESRLADIRASEARLAAARDDHSSVLLRIESDRSSKINEQARLLEMAASARALIESLARASEKLAAERLPVIDALALAQAGVEQGSSDLAARTADRLELTAERARAGDEIVSLESRKGGLRDSSVAVDSRRQTLLAWEKTDARRTALHAVMDARISGIRGSVGSVLRIQEGMESSVAAALGDALDYVIAETAEAANAAIGLLAGRQLGRLTFVILAEIPALPSSNPSTAGASVRSLVSLLTADESYRSLVAFLAGEITVDGTTIRSRCLMQGGGAITFERPVLIDDQLRRLNDEAQAIVRETAAVAAQMDVLRERADGLDRRIEGSAIEIRRIELALQDSTTRVAALSAQISALDREIELNRTDAVRHDAEAAEISVRIEGIARSLSELETTAAKTAQDLQETDRLILENRRQSSELAPVLTEAKVAWATKNNEFQNRLRERDTLRATLEYLERHRTQARAEQESIKAAQTGLRDESAREGARSAEASVALAAKEREVQAALGLRLELQAGIDERSAAYLALREQVDALKQASHALQLDLRSAELQRQNLEQRLTEEYAVVFEDARETHLNVEVEEGEILRLRKRIESIGPVNLAAPEEYTALEQRYQFLDTQLLDLQKAKDDLHSVIAKINQTTRESFKVTFDRVRENFRLIYRQLFEGGEADLRMSDEGNILESGIEIFAQPPGKRLLNITQLSGGEKALTAIALLFAFFLERPSPFCILDEVDAPLDEANIGRFLGMIRSYARNSQFIIITHNKRTMEMADVLYGVTMEELGVSKTISVRMNKEAQPEPAAVG